MRSAVALLAVALSAFPAAWGAGERITARCNPNFGTGEVLTETAPFTDARARLQALVANPALDPDLYHRLWRPASTGITGPYFVLRYDWVQDTGEISRALLADPQVVAAGITRATPSNTSGSCFALLPPAIRVKVTEYRNALTNHYFLSSSDAENAAIDSGAAGAGWTRTGETFDATASYGCADVYPVFRFYTRGANSHFFTVDASECGFLRNNDPGWLFEGNAFGAKLPTAGVCPFRTSPLYRLYNQRWFQNDSNHRFVKRLDLYQQMQSQGWAGEGVAMCLENVF